MLGEGEMKHSIQLLCFELHGKKHSQPFPGCHIVELYKMKLLKIIQTSQLTDSEAENLSQVVCSYGWFHQTS